MRIGRNCFSAASIALIPAAAALAAPTTVVVRIENISPSNGTYVTPLFVGFHNGQFDILNPASAASTAVERLAEDGDTAPLAADFLASGAGLIQGTIPGPGGVPPVFPPGTSGSQSFVLESTAATSRFFSFGAMIVPSN